MYTPLFLLISAILAISSRARTSVMIAINHVITRLHEGIARDDDQSRCSKPKVRATAVTLTSDEIRTYRIMFHQLHNIEEHPFVRVSGRTLLETFLSDCLLSAKGASAPTILSIDVFDPETIKNFIKTKEQMTTSQWEAYLFRRKTGGPRELFANRERAKTWLKRKAPLRCVDGAWLGHIHKVDTPFYLRAVTKNAWQILSEELGDGDLNKNHVNVYRTLLKKIGVELPDSHDIDFIHPRHELRDGDIWKAAVVQLLISLYPHDFFPEILGFNFLLHVCIDNGDSGHTAMASKIVLDYVQLVRTRDGARAASKAWMRIQLGFLLSESLERPSSTFDLVDGTLTSSATALETDVARIFKAKSSVAQKLHTACPMKLSGRTLAEWLDPQVGWGGSMFGSFTQAEVKTIGQWIDSLGSATTSIYPDQIGLDEAGSAHSVTVSGNRSACPMALSKHAMLDYQIEAFERTQTNIRSLGIDLSRPIIIEKFMPLGFVQSCLLECLVSVPSKTNSTVAAAVIQILRAQHGFAIEGEGVAGIDEVHRNDVVDLIAIGQDMMIRAGWASVDSLTEVLQRGDCEDAIAMLDSSSRPMANEELLIGMSAAFADLHIAMVSAKAFSILGAKTAKHLAEIASREQNGLEICCRILDDDMAKRREFNRGFHIAKLAIERCF